MNSINNNQFEIKSLKRKYQSGPNVYLNPGLDLLANEDRICNTAMEVELNKKRKYTKTSDSAAFENTALDLGKGKPVVNEVLQQELNNVCNIKLETNAMEGNCGTNIKSEPVYVNETDINMDSSNNNTELNGVLTDLDTVVCEVDSGIFGLDQKSLHTETFSSEMDMNDLLAMNTTNIQNNANNQMFVNNNSNLSLSFIDRLALNSPASNQSLYLDDDLNESNIMEIKTITKKQLVQTKNTNPFLDSCLNVNDVLLGDNPFLSQYNPELEYNIQAINNDNPLNIIRPRKLFENDTNSTISTVDESSASHDYENIDNYLSETPIYENVGEFTSHTFNKQSKILGYDVSHFSAVDIMNLNKITKTNNPNENKKDIKQHLLKARNNLSKKVFKTLKKKFKGEKVVQNNSLNPYEVPRKVQKIKLEKIEVGIVNPALDLDNFDDIEIEELDDEEHHYETIETFRNTQLNKNITPLKEKVNENHDLSNNRTYTPSKRVRFDSTLNQEKFITGNSFDCDVQSPEVDSKIDKYHDELENCINEKKFLQQNM